MDIMSMLSVGTWWQNIAFYTFLTLLMSLNFELFRIDSKQKKFRTSIPNK